MHSIQGIEKLEGIRAFRTRLIARGSGICLPGIGIFIHLDIPPTAQKRILQHEYGHYLDYKYGVNGDRKRFLGSYLLGFYVKVGLPSLFNLVPGLNKLAPFAGPHGGYWTELRANQLAARHFGSLLASDFKRYFPLD